MRRPNVLDNLANQLKSNCPQRNPDGDHEQKGPDELALPGW